MLVLSRVEGQGISFPELDMAIEVLKISGNRIQLGVTAAEEIRVLRSELMNRVETISTSLDISIRHQIRNRLNAVSLAMSLAQKHLERGDLKSAEKALEKVSSVACTQAHKADEPEASATVNVTKHSKTITVLLVEDNPNESKLLADILKMHGIQVRIADNGIEALKLLESTVPDAVLIDMHMPICDGPKTIAQIRQDERLRALPIYAVTGVSKEESMVMLSDTKHVNDWFQKPVQSQLLLDALKELPGKCLAC